MSTVHSQRVSQGEASPTGGFAGEHLLSVCAPRSLSPTPSVRTWSPLPGATP